MGHVAQVCHLPGMATSRHVDVVAGAELQEGVLERVSAQWSLNPYKDYEAMLREEALDIACILTGPKYSTAIANRVADAGVNILVEKPMALRVEDASAIEGRCLERGVQLFYGESFRFFPVLRKAKDILDSGTIGDLRLLLETVVIGKGARGFEEYGIYPAGAPGSGPMGLTDHGIHMIDVFRWLSGVEPAWVTGRGNRAGNPPLAEFMTIGTEGGAIAQFVGDEATVSSNLPGEGIQCASPYEGGGPAWDPTPISFRIHCSEGALRAFPYANRLYLFGREEYDEVEVQDCPHPGQFGLQIDSFARSIVDGEEPEITSRDGIAALRAVLGAYDSFESSTVVRL